MVYSSLSYRKCSFDQNVSLWHPCKIWEFSQTLFRVCVWLCSYLPTLTDPQQLHLDCPEVMIDPVLILWHGWESLFFSWLNSLSHYGHSFSHLFLITWKKIIFVFLYCLLCCFLGSGWNCSVDHQLQRKMYWLQISDNPMILLTLS